MDNKDPDQLDDLKPILDPTPISLNFRVINEFLFLISYLHLNKCP